MKPQAMLDQSVRFYLALLVFGLLSACGQSSDSGTADSEAAGEESSGAEQSTSQSNREHGFTESEIIFGTHTDLTGPIALYGVETVNAINMRFDEENEKGGVHGRTLRLISEDSQYQVPESLRAANKLINKDKIFAMLLALGTPNNNAVMPEQFKAGIPNLFPLTGSIQMGEPFHKLKFTARGIYYYEMRTAIKHFVGELGHQRPCVVYIDNDYGQEIFDGVNDEAAELGVEIVQTTSHRSTESEFTAAVLKLKDAQCDLVIMGTVVRDSILFFETVRKQAWTGATFVGNNAAAGQPVAEIESGASEGYFAFTHMVPIYPDIETDENNLAWFNKYVSLYGAEPDVPAMEGYRGADLVIDVLQRVGPDLSRQAFLDELENTSAYADPFGYTLTFGPDDHRGVDSSALIKVVDKKWVRQELTVSYD